jgi:methionyl-tRNA synthetase
VRLVTGTDEHGEKIAASSAAAGMPSPQDHVDAVSLKFRALWASLGIEPDAFVRTTQVRHSSLVKAVLDKVWAKGDIYKGSYEGYYCVGCEEYKDETDLVPVEEEDEEGGGGRRKSFHCPLHAKACDMRSEENYFFRLSRYEGRVRELLAQGGGAGAGSSPSPSEASASTSTSSSPSDDLVPFVSPRARRNEIATWAAGGLRDFSISRAAVSWGVPLPRDPAQTVYVWFDALLGYASALLTEEEAAGIERLRVENAAEDESPSAAADAAIALLEAKGWPPSLHLVGKDILRFHAAYWPGMCLSAGLPLPGAVFAHGFLTKDGRKMGKSLGNVLDPNELVARFGADAVRFFLCAGVAFGSDGDFAAARFADVVNAALANTLGNLVNRSASLLHKFFEGGELPCSADEAVAVVDAYFSSSSSGAAPGAACRSAALAAVEASRLAYDAAALHEAAAGAVAAAAAGNALLDATAPWSLLKKAAAELSAAEAAGDAAAEAAARGALRAGGASLVLALEAARLSAVALAPVIPALSERVLLSLGETRTKSGGGGGAGAGSGGDGTAPNGISWERDTRWGGLRGGTALPVPSPVFSRIELSEEEGGAAAAAAGAAAGGGGGKKKGGGGGPQQPKKQQQPKKTREEEAAPAA